MLDPRTAKGPGGQVAPHTGAWIEIVLVLVAPLLHIVAPHTGAWIEIFLAVPFES